MGAGSSVPKLYLNAWQINKTANRKHPYANDETRRGLIHRLLLYPLPKEELLAAGFLNSDISEAIQVFIGTNVFDLEAETTELSAAMDSDASDSDEEQLFEEGILPVDPIAPKRLAIELLVSTLIRNRNSDIKVYFSAVLSILALQTGMHRQLWQVFTSMGVLYSKPWTKKIARELGKEIEERVVDGMSLEVLIVVVDNKSYFKRLVYTHQETDQQEANGRFLHTVNVLRSPVMHPHLGIQQGV